MYNYKELIVWQKSMTLVEKVYKLTSNFPAEENLDLQAKYEDAPFPYLAILQKEPEGNQRKYFANF
ncbi:hypothetical protein ZORO111902_11175 [Zobellia roscoffensis]|nr:four helix bundle protein [Zobellia roscoffensis]